MKRSWLLMELEDLEIGKTRMIGWEAVTRWGADSYEIGTWGLVHLRKSLVEALDRLCALRHITEVTE